MERVSGGGLFGARLLCCDPFPLWRKGHGVLPSNQSSRRGLGTVTRELGNLKPWCPPHESQRPAVTWAGFPSCGQGGQLLAWGQDKVVGLVWSCRHGVTAVREACFGGPEAGQGRGDPAASAAVVLSAAAAAALSSARRKPPESPGQGSAHFHLPPARGPGRSAKQVESPDAPSPDLGPRPATPTPVPVPYHTDLGPNHDGHLGPRLSLPDPRSLTRSLGRGRGAAGGGRRPLSRGAGSRGWGSLSPGRAGWGCAAQRARRGRKPVPHLERSQRHVHLGQRGDPGNEI